MKTKVATGYSEDLRTKVLDFIDQGNTKILASKLFGIGRDTIYRWIRLRKDTGMLKAKVRVYLPLKVDYQKLQEIMKNKPDSTLKELGSFFNMSGPGMGYVLERLKITRKKRQLITKKETRKDEKSL